LMPTRNHFGIIGPIPRSEFEPEAIQKKIAANPLIKGNEGKPRILTITQSTYDGIVYNVETLKGMLDGKVDTMHFDEAWLPHAAFHDFYRDMHAIGGTGQAAGNADNVAAQGRNGASGRQRNQQSMIFATHSTHKLLAGLSQASQILIQDSQTEKLDRHMFNEAFLMHTSTSPQYAIIASCDVAAAMMEPPGGTALVEESLAEALDFRRAMRKVDAELGEDWWFRVWGPEKLAADGVGKREDWMLKTGDKWHGFGKVVAGFNMLDPIKATVITPGLNLNGSFTDPGIPASVVTKYLAEHGIVVEKTGLYSFFIMFTIGITKGRWNTMVTELQQFKDDYDKNQPLWRILPEFIRAFPQYEKMGLRDLCDAIHSVYKANDIARLTTEMYLSEMEPVLIPADAYAHMAHSAIDRVPIDAIDGRVSAVLLTPYPPGIPLLIPGERVNAKIVNYLKFAREFNARFPGFETDIHGLVKERSNGKAEYFLDCVRSS
ncbi:MAG TPA: aminotransferase class I/II-fold pyridoxal phosphate-dependent enzyme, partial [Burkholderiaceae bacterium]|nr:aminotransferase class I/II-fold pyridoxal phosphate-dependent enzyme [Burkholderiaceae bacterium]